uniref:T-cell surface glycoprotein CD8 beta chain-like n=1 Tax=Neolamprologus brichardi TaxID=32507 RepID=A0A3Q4MQC3_NEOBR
ISNFTLTGVALWGISISASDFQTTKVQPGEDVTLQCANNSKWDSLTFWFRMVNSTTVSCISLSLNSEREATYSDGFQNGKFEMTTNISTLFLKIKKVDQSDSGLYFCGFYDRCLVFSVTVFTATYLKVQEDGLTNLSTLILGSLTVFLLLVIIGLVVSIRKLHTESDAMNYAALSFHTRTNMRRPPPQRELEPNVLYAATR